MPQMKYFDGITWIPLDAKNAETLQGKLPSDFVQKVSSARIALTLENGWAEDATYTAQAIVTDGGVAYLNGVITNPADVAQDGVIAVLPEGARPIAPYYAALPGGAILKVATDGTMTIGSAYTANASIALSAIFFPVR